jgi:diacylglycerol kinase family enzyme
VREIDLGAIQPCNQEAKEEVPFCCVAGIGMDAEANARANRLPPWLKGRGGYLLTALRSLIAFKAVEMSAIAEGREIRRSAFFIAVGNAYRYGGGMKVTPYAAPDDQLLDVCFVSQMNKLKLLCWVPTIFFGVHLRLRQVEYFQTPQVRIEAGRPLKVYADGDYICLTPVNIRLISKALRVIMPARILL